MNNIKPSKEILILASREIIKAKEPFIEEMMRIYETSPTMDLSLERQAKVDELKRLINNSTKSILRKHNIE